MKKLMTAAAVLAFGCVAHAANFTWGFYSDSIIKIGGGSDDYLSGGTAFLYLGIVTASDTAFNLNNATFLASAGQSDNYDFGVFDSNNPASSEALTSTAKNQAFTLILVDKSVASLDGYEGHYIITSGLKSEEGTDPQTGATWCVFIDTTAYSGSVWSTMPVPEPTSGLLLFLGMAGLALKRKRA